jgi:hypothetical protein
VRFSFLGLIAAAFAMHMTATPALAKVGDKAWAKCVWTSSPVSAEIWLGEETPTWRDYLQTKGEILGFRLIALCSSEAADPENPNRVPKWKSIKRRLSKERPDNSVERTLSDVRVELCEYYSVGEGVRSLYQIQQFFSTLSGKGLETRDKFGRSVRITLGGSSRPDSEQRVRLPQVPMMTSPAEGFATEMICQTINEDGSLADA